MLLNVAPVPTFYSVTYQVSIGLSVPWYELDCYFSSETLLRRRSATALKRYVATQRPLPCPQYILDWHYLVDGSNNAWNDRSKWIWILLWHPCRQCHLKSIQFGIETFRVSLLEIFIETYRAKVTLGLLCWRSLSSKHTYSICPRLVHHNSAASSSTYFRGRTCAMCATLSMLCTTHPWKYLNQRKGRYWMGTMSWQGRSGRVRTLWAC